MPPSLSLSAPRHTRSLSISSTRSDTSVVTADQAGGGASGRSGAPTISAGDNPNPFREAEEWVSELTRPDLTQQLTISIDADSLPPKDASTQEENSQDKQAGDAFTHFPESRGQQDIPAGKAQVDENLTVRITISLTNPTKARLEEATELLQANGSDFHSGGKATDEQQEDPQPEPSLKLHIASIAFFDVVILVQAFNNARLRKLLAQATEDGEGTKRMPEHLPFERFKEVWKEVSWGCARILSASSILEENGRRLHDEEAAREPYKDYDEKLGSLKK